MRQPEHTTVPAKTAALPGSDRPRPASPELERAVISAMLREPEPCVDVAVSILGRDAEAFYVQQHRDIFSAILDISDSSDRKVDLVAVAHQLQQRGKGDEIDAVYLGDLYATVATTANIETWCRSLHDLHMLRRMISVCTESLLQCYDTSARPAALIEKIETSVYNIRNTGAKSDYVPLKECLGPQFDHLLKVARGELEVGIPTGYSQLDDYTGGLKPGEMFVLAARPSIGKTALALNIIRNIVLPSRTPHPRRVVFFSLEMTTDQITRRLLCTEAKVPAEIFQRRTFMPADLARLKAAMETLAPAKLYIDPTPGLSVAEMRAKARRMYLTKDEDGNPMIDVIVVDYLQLMHADVGNDGRQNEVAAISGGLKSLAKELNIPVLVLAQLNRDIDKNASPDALPKLSHLRESGAIEQDADVVAFLHRKRDEAKDLPPDQSVEAKLIVEKNRNGKTGIVPLFFFPARTEFTAASPYTAADEPPTRQ